MTTEEFDKTSFTLETKVEYKGRIYEIEAIDIEERLIAINQYQTFDKNGMDEFVWKRCENIIIH